MPGTNRKPLVAVDNFLDYIIANRDHTVAAPLGSGVLQGDLRSLWDGRRGSRSTVTIDRDGGTNDAYIQVQLPSDDYPTMLWMDAGHNMDGESVIVQRYDQSGGFQENVVVTTVGSTSGNAVALDDGSWAVYFGTQTADDEWRVLFDNVAVDPTLSLMFLGKASQLGNYARSAAQDDSRDVQYPGALRSQRGVHGFGQKPVVARNVALDYRTTLNEYDGGGYIQLEDVLDLFIDNRSPMIFCYDWATNPERMRLYINRASGVDPNWSVPGYRNITLDMTEVL